MPPAQANLGLLYDHGQGVPQDDEQAVKWYALAADQGEPYAQNSLGLMYKAGYGVPQDDVIAYKWLNLAAQQGHAGATKALASLAERMTSEQIEQARQLTSEWRRK